MNLTTYTPTDFHAFIHPAAVFQTPEDVLHNPTLSDAEKRVVLSSWASDANVVESQPWLRQIPGADPVPIATILAALRRLDGDDPPPKGGMAMRWRGLARRLVPADCIVSDSVASKVEPRQTGLAA